MFNQIKTGSRFSLNGQTYIVLEVMGSYCRIRSVQTKEETIVSLQELKTTYHSLDDYVTPQEEQMYLKWAKEILESPEVRKAIALCQEKEKLEELWK